MLVKYHVLIGAIISFFIYFLFQITPFQATIIFLASFLIDFDHYLFFVFKKKNFSLKDAHKYFLKNRVIWIKLSKQEKREYKNSFLIFHGIELIIILLLLSIFSNLFIFILIGVLIHLFLDYIDLYYYNENLLVKISQTYVYFSNFGKKEF